MSIEHLIGFKAECIKLKCSIVRTIPVTTMCYNVVMLVLLASTCELVVGKVDLTHAIKAMDVFPRVVYEIDRTKRDVRGSRKEGSVVKVIEVGEWSLVLDPPTDNLRLAEGLLSEWWHADGSQSTHPPPRCEFRAGAVRGEAGGSRAAVALCGTEVRAHFRAGGKAYFLDAADERTGKHVLYHSDLPHFPQKRSATAKTSVHNSIADQWLYNLTGDTFDIDDGDGETHFEFDYQEGVEGVGPDGTITSTNPTEDFVTLEGTDQRYWAGEDGYFYDIGWNTNTVQVRKPMIRNSTSTLPPRWMEIAVAVDHTVISFHGRKKVEQYVLSLLNIVSAIYQDPSLGANLQLVVTRLLFYERDKHRVIRRGDAKRSLENVNQWNRRLHASMAPVDPSRHDVAIWLTRSDIGGPSGYAPVGGACDPKRSCALNRDEGLTSAFIIAHETAHILGLSHDGDLKNNNNCSQEALEGSVMAPMVSATFNKFFWSECSKNDFRKYSGRWSCLWNQPSGVGDIPLNATLQTAFTMDQQCRMEFGEGFAMCRAFEIIEPCQHLWCGHEKSPMVCKTKKGPPLEGTECGFGKWCMNGYCEDFANRRVERVPIVLNPQDGEWGRWEPWGNCSRPCGMGVKFRNRKCDSPPPSYGGKQCVGKSEEWSVCRERECPEPLIDMRELQCKQLPRLFDSEGKRDLNFTWLPYESDENAKKCKFICLNAERKELYISAENLIDGTPCSYDNQDNICVQGQCQVVGCDGILHSTKERDRCGVCGGNNSKCSEKKSFLNRKLRRESSRIAILPRMAREIRVEINVTIYHSDNPLLALILKNRKKKKYVVSIPNTVVHTKILDGAKFYYNKFNNRHSIWSKGPLQNELVILAIVPKKELRAGMNISYSTAYSIHEDHLIPSKRYSWIIGGWGPCSTSCNGGRRHKTTACWDNLQDKIVSRNYCSLMNRPKLQSEKCNTFGCSFEWIAGEWEPCTASCGTHGTQERQLYCVPNSALFLILHQFNGTIKEPWKYMVHPKRCANSKPLSSRSCNREPCFSYWNFTDWSQCSASCGHGTQTRSSVCPPPGDETFFTCGPAPPVQKRTCAGPFTRQTNALCRGSKRRKCEKDKSEYCSFDLFHKYCALNGFKRLCCKSCTGRGRMDGLFYVAHSI